MMNPPVPPRSVDPEFSAVVSLLQALADPAAAAQQLAKYAAKAEENAAGAAAVQAAGEKLAADTKQAHANLSAAKSDHEASVAKRRLELDVAGAALEQRSKGLDAREAKLDSREASLNSRDAQISRREKTFAQAASLLAG